MSGFKFSILLAGVLGLVANAGNLSAQSAFSTRGLGVEIEPLDARARALGGSAVGFMDPEISWYNTAASAGLAVPGIIFAYQYENYESLISGTTTHGRAARFPLILAGFPVSERVTLTAGYGSFLDQSWRLERQDTIAFAGDSTIVTDEISSTGGVARLRGGVAYGVLPNLSLGLSLDSYVGEVERVQGRRFPGERVPGCCRGTYNYSGIGYGGSFQWAPSEALSLGGSATYGGTLKAEVISDTTETRFEESGDRRYELPLQLRGGVTGRVGQATIVTLGGGWNGWSGLDDLFAAQGGARDSWSANAGAEWEGLIVRDRPVPLRVGARTATLPFRWVDSTAAGFADERAFSFGAGLVLAGGAARSDLAAEFGERVADGSSFSESFWRFAFSVRVLGR
jgi:hypothetical protein